MEIKLALFSLFNREGWEWLVSKSLPFPSPSMLSKNGSLTMSLYKEKVNNFQPRTADPC